MTTQGRRSFFATTAGIVTGVAGLVTAVVGLLTVGAQLGWFGSEDDGGGGGSGPAATGAGASTTVVAQFTVDPSRVAFEVLGPRESLVRVHNNSQTVPITWRAPSIEGADRAMFNASDVSCGARLGPGLSCEVRVRFAPARNGDYTARLVLQPENGPAREVDLAGKALL
ncbi:MAG: hypothetical protein ACRD2W_02090 [Acidimicrobiales bacterium]